MKIWIASDHGGFALKEKFIAQMKEQGHEVTDVGCYNTESVRYPHYAVKVTRAVVNGEADRGVLVCSTGIGMSIYANKFPGVRAALCFTTVMADMTRRHNDSNILCLGGKITGEWEALRILDVWLGTEYEGGRHAVSLGLIEEAEKVNMTGKIWEPLDE